ncbi:hypothetical protein GW17_00010352 [Ensete ventricosum]|nr:hypothetical protein GW17_00010352 [Ensete ventricosum]
MTGSNVAGGGPSARPEANCSRPYDRDRTEDDPGLKKKRSSNTWRDVVAPRYSRFANPKEGTVSGLWRFNYGVKDALNCVTFDKRSTSLEDEEE